MLEYKQYFELQHVALLCKQRDGQVLLLALLNRACRVVCSELVPNLSLVLLVPVGLFLWSQ